jgi:hypothetical protein
VEAEALRRYGCTMEMLIDASSLQVTSSNLFENEAAFHYICLSSPLYSVDSKLGFFQFSVSTLESETLFFQRSQSRCTMASPSLDVEAAAAERSSMLL